MWLYKDKELTEVPKDAYGFVYKITNLLDGRMYIGRKYFWSVRKVKGKKKRVKKESDWRTYYGSSADLCLDVETFGEESFKREILSLHDTKGQVNYAEIQLQFEYDVLFCLNKNAQRVYYNRNIMSRWFAPEDFNYVKNAEALLENFSEQKQKLNGEKLAKESIEYWKNLSIEEKQKKIEQLHTLNEVYLNTVPCTILLDTGKEIVYNSQVDAAKEIDITLAFLRKMLKQFDEKEWIKKVKKHKNCVNIY